MNTLKSLLGAAIVGMGLSSCSTYSLINSQTYNDANLADYHTFRIVTPQEGKLPPGMELVTYYNIAAAIREQMVDRGFVEDPMSPIVINIGVTVNKELATEPISVAAPAPPPPVFLPGPNANAQPEPATSETAEPAPQHRPGLPPGPPPGGPGGGPHFMPYPGPAPIPPAAPFFMMPRPLYWNNAYYSNAQVITGIYKEGVLTMDIVDMNTKTPLFSASVATILDNGDSQFRNLSGIAQAVKTLFKKFPVPLLPQYKNN